MHPAEAFDCCLRFNWAQHTVARYNVLVYTTLWGGTYSKLNSSYPYTGVGWQISYRMHFFKYKYKSCQKNFIPKFAQKLVKLGITSQHLICGPYSRICRGVLGPAHTGRGSWQPYLYCMILCPWPWLIGSTVDTWVKLASWILSPKHLELVLHIESVSADTQMQRVCSGDIFGYKAWGAQEACLERKEWRNTQRWETALLTSGTWLRFLCETWLPSKPWSRTKSWVLQIKYSILAWAS